MIIITRRPAGLVELEFKTARTTGSMVADSHDLTVADASSFEVGDPIIVEVGGESGGGLINTTGVGGIKVGPQPEDTHRYYATHSVPMALVTTVESIAGNVLTLADAAVVSTTNATIWHDNYARWMDQADGEADWTRWEDTRIIFPAGQIAFAPTTLFGTLHFGTPHRALIEGVDTRIVHPRGVFGASFACHAPEDVMFRNFTFQGNFKLNGWMIRNDEGWVGGCGVGLSGNSLRPVIHNIHGIDPSRTVVTIGGGTGARIYRCTSYRSEAAPLYVGWDLQSANCFDARWYECGSESDYLHTALETFQGEGDQFIRCTGRNALVAMNNAGGWRFDDCRFDYEAGSYYSDGVAPRTNPAINVNTNIGTTPVRLALGGIIHNTRVIFAGYTAPDGDMLKPININASNPNVEITGDDYSKALIQAPNWDSDSTDGYGPAIHSTGANTTVRGVRIIGAANPSFGNISLAGSDGSVAEDCVADVINAETETNNQTNAEYEA